MTFRRAAKVDSNQAEIIAAFKKLGCAVLNISQLKKCCDLVVSSRLTALVEVKNGNLSPSKRRLSEGEDKFRKEWKGAYFIVEKIDDIPQVVKYLNM